MFNYRHNNVLLSIWAITMLLFRPCVIGEEANVAIYFIFVTLTFLIAILNARSYLLQAKNFKMALCILVLMVYLFCQGLLLSDALSSVVNSSIVIIGVTFCLMLILNNKNNNQIILKAIIYFHFLLCVSAILTFILLCFNHFNVKSVPLIAKLYLYSKGGPAEEIYGEHAILFPVTLIWGRLTTIGFDFPRFLGIYRESGMTQIFYITCYFLTFFIDLRFKRVVRFSLLFGSILTFSTGGFISLAFGYIFMTLFNKSKGALLIKKGLIILLSAGILSIAIFLPGLGIMSKSTQINGIDRTNSYSYSIKRFLDSPFIGQGYYKGFSKDSEGRFNGEQGFIGLIGTVYQFGLIGLILYFFCWFYSFAKFARPSTYCIYIPCIITLLISQPSYNDIFTWFIMMFDKRSINYIG